ncbi:LOW QUALITY PROTEIN: probable serine/threonine-protein kinase PBL11 [Herrania umbratica]|uniref:LOW QUALITY PROTEIN: probable serine/threonine-protein kinase PBL11 n=1 Tax=Herrania umbratica TaxID=108875 RepID=A0A6J1BKR8_9ROSI|nr:LOW QUALITY PROTEIN: probable serine/threonine-protein kinase PBL11 [Herrania umbratica]
MGNCLRKKTQDLNYPQPKPAHPPTGVDAIHISGAKKISTSSVQQRTSSGYAISNLSLRLSSSLELFLTMNDPFILFFIPDAAKPSKDEQCGATLQDRSRHVSSYSCKVQRRNKKQGFPTNPRDWPVSKVKKVGWVPARNINSFCYSVLRAATQKFSEENLIGEGGFGGVYLGYINISSMDAAKPNTGRAVAIKKLGRRGVQGDEQWKNELRFLSTFNHPNVVTLVGYCYKRDNRLLVYEYMCKGSLDAHLSSENDTELNWSRRIKIAVGAARAVDYLHTRAKPVIHRDLKASNILLDADFNPKLSDFGLARFGPLDDQSYVSTRILGTRGYFAPEYFKTGHLTVKTDVYSFGVVLLEILSGCVAVKKYADGTTRDLPVWAKPHLSNQMELRNIIDKRIARNIEMDEAHKFATISRQCLSSDPKDRPTMSEVLADLEQLQRNMLLSNLNSIGLSKYHRCRRALIF